MNSPLILSDPLGLDPWWRGNCKDGRCDYQEAIEKPDGNWKQIDFGGMQYTTVEDWCKTGQTAYLYANGGQDFGWRAKNIYDPNMSFNRVANSFNDPKLITIRHPEVATQGGAVMWMGAPIFNILPSTYNLGAWGANSFGANLPYAPTMEPDENTPGIAKGFYYGSSIGLAVQGGFSGVSRSFATETNQAVFWSGSSQARSAATAYAEITGGSTIEMTFGGRMMNTFSPTLRSMGPRARTFDNFLWRQASKPFARQASGNPNVFLQYPLRPGSTWTTVEQPILKARGIDFQIYRLNF